MLETDFYECLIGSPRFYANVVQSERLLLYQQDQFQHTLNLCERLSATLIQLQADYTALHTSFYHLSHAVASTPDQYLSSVLSPPSSKASSRREPVVDTPADNVVSTIPNESNSSVSQPAVHSSPLLRMSRVFLEHADLCQLWRSGVICAIEELTHFLQETRRLPELRKAVKHTAEAWEAAQLKSASLPSTQESVDNATRAARNEHWKHAFGMLSFLRKSRLLAQRQGVKTMLQLLQAHGDHARQSNEFMLHVQPWLEQAKEQVGLVLVEEGREVQLQEETRLQSESLLHSSVNFAGLTTDSGVLVEGYLQLKRSWRQWCRRWFQIRNNQLVYYKSVPLSGGQPPVLPRATSVERYELVTCPSSPPMRPTHSSSSASSTNPLSSHSTRSSQSQHSSQLKAAVSSTSTTASACPSPEFRVLVPDLRLCTARMPPDTCERRWAFEIVLASRETHLLQAYSEEERDRWMEVLKEGMMAMSHGSNGHLLASLSSNQQGGSKKPHSLSDPMNPMDTDLLSSTSSLMNPSTGDTLSLPPQNSGGVGQVLLDRNQQINTQRALCAQRILQVRGNDRCCDCGSEQVRWAALNLGITLCSLCSGVHRTLFSPPKVRSLTLDHWEPASFRLMRALGNDCVNSVYEACEEEIAAMRVEGLEKPSAGANPSLANGAAILVTQQRKTSDNVPGMNQRLAWLTAKWLDKRFVRVPTSWNVASIDNSKRVLLANEELWAAVRERRVDAMMAAMARGARLNDVIDAQSGITPLMRSVRGPSLAATEFLLVNGAQCNTRDRLGRTALHHATLKERLQQVCLLLKRGADPNQVDGGGSTALNVALKLQNAHIVTVLRLRVLRDDSPTPGSGAIAASGASSVSSSTFRDDASGGGTSYGALCPSSVDMVNDVFKDFTLSAYDQLTDDEDEQESDDETHDERSNNIDIPEGVPEGEVVGDDGMLLS